MPLNLNRIVPALNHHQSDWEEVIENKEGYHDTICILKGVGDAHGRELNEVESHNDS